jgi:hypothetical protein
VLTQTEGKSRKRELPGTKSKWRGKTERISVSLTPIAVKKLQQRKGQFRILSASDTVEHLIREHL